jgi:branched-chain amino acid transport system substrate-binding protein
MREEQVVRSRWRGMAIVLTGAALALAGCQGEQLGGSGGGKASSAEGPENAPTIYASLPMEGPDGQPNQQSEAILNAMRLALKQEGGRAGELAVRFQPLDNSTREAGGWDAGQTILNVREVVDDPHAIAYLGDFDSGAAATSIPLLNEAGIPQIGFSTTAVGLTKDEPGADKNEPRKYNPSGDTTFVRVVPRDTLQGAVLGTLLKTQGCSQVAILHDKEVYGAGLAKVVEGEVNRRGMDLLSSEAIDPGAENYEGVARRLGERSVDCVLYTGNASNNAVQLFEDLAAGLSSAKLFGADGVATASFYDPEERGVSDTTGARIRLTAPKLPPQEYGAEGRKFFADYQAEYGEEPSGPYPIYGYEAMKLALRSIAQAGPQATDPERGREAVRARLAETSNRASALGTYNLDEGGDTSLDDYATYTIEDGKLTFGEVIEPTRE